MTQVRPQPRAVIVHGYGAGPEEHWFGWLAAQFGAIGVNATVPALPDPTAPHPSAWAAAVDAAVGRPDEQTTLVGHSLGSIVVLRHLAGLDGDWRLGHLALVAGFADPLPDLPELDEFVTSCDLDRVRRHADHITVMRSDNDSIVPAGHTDALADRLGTRPVVAPGRGHFLASEGASSLPELWQQIERFRLSRTSPGPRL